MSSQVRDFKGFTGSRFQSFTGSRLRSFASSRFQIFTGSRPQSFAGSIFQIFIDSTSLKTYLMNFVKPDISRVTDFPEFPNTIPSGKRVDSDDLIP
jgi:hypothetical protein